MRIWTVFLVIFLPLIVKAQGHPDFPEGITVLGSDTIYCPDIQRGDTVEAVFYIANKGKKRFWIYQIYASCQCTAPQYSNDTFEPGRLDSVVLYFHSRNIEEPVYEKYALVLTPLGEKSFYLIGKINQMATDARLARKIRITNQSIQ